MKKLIFVYNADSGRLNTLFDMAHKIIKPETYQCSLCAITHDTFSEKKSWATFRETSGLDLEFLHKDEFERKYKKNTTYPVILVNNEQLDILIDTNELKELTETEALILRIKTLTN